MKSFLPFLILCLIAFSCKAPPEHKPLFEHDITGGPTPWTSETFELEEADFTFAIISDLTGWRACKYLRYSSRAVKSLGSNLCT